MQQLDIREFNNIEFKQLRTIVTENEFYFAAADIATALGYSDTNKMIRRMDKEYLKNIDELRPPKMGTLENTGLEGFEDTTIHNIKNMYFLTEPGLYQAIFGSKKEQAIRFQKWVFEEVIPSIRKHGAYVNNQENKTAEQIAIDITKAYTSIIEEKTNKLIDAEKSLELLNKTVEEQKQILLKQQEQYNTLKQDYIDYASIYEERYRGKIARNKFNTKVNNISRELNIPQKFIYNAVYYFFFSYRRVNIKVDKALDYIFSKKEYAQDAYTILERLHREPRAFYYNYIY